MQRNFLYIFQSKYVGRTIYEWNWELPAQDQGLCSMVFKFQQRKQIFLFFKMPGPALGTTEPPIELVPLIFLSQKAPRARRWPLNLIIFTFIRCLGYKWLPLLPFHNFTKVQNGFIKQSQLLNSHTMEIIVYTYMTLFHIAVFLHQKGISHVKNEI